MKTPLFALALIALPLFAGQALAAENCSVQAGTAQSGQALQQKLEAEGWQVQQITLNGGCYQVTAVKADGSRLDSEFNAATLEDVGDSVSEDLQIASFISSVQDSGAGSDDDGEDGDDGEDDDGEDEEDGEGDDD